MRTRLNVRGSKENQRFPMHNVYTEAIRCLITYVLVASILLVSPTGGVMRVLAATTNETIDEATMICCEKGRNCLGSYNGWFHIHCIEELKNLPTEEAENVKFICNECKGKQL